MLDFIVVFFSKIEELEWLTLIKLNTITINNSM